MGETAKHEDEYDDALVAMLELIWGEGFLSPGGLLLSGDWCRGPEPFSRDMEDFFALEGPTYHMDTFENWRMLTVVLDGGEPRPGRLRAQKPD